jgi:hypothetical protein
LPGRSNQARRWSRGDRYHIVALTPFRRSAQFIVLGFDLLSAGFDALVHNLLNRAEGDNSAVSLLGKHFKTQKASVVAGDGQANNLADRRGFRGTVADYWSANSAIVTNATCEGDNKLTEADLGYESR